MLKRFFVVLGLVTLIGFSNSNAAGNSREVTRKEFGEKWPLTVDKGVIECRQSFGPKSGVVVFVAGGKTYALNGLAKSRKFADIEPIWRPNPDIPQLKMDIGRLIEEALKLCK